MATLSLATGTGGLSAQETATGSNRTGKTTVGNATSLRNYTTANIVAAVKIAAAANSNVATLTLSSGAVAQTTGSPVITDAAIDSFGDALPTLVKAQGIRIRTGAAIPGGTANTGTVTLAGSSGGIFPAVTLTDDTDLVLLFPVAGKAVTTSTIAFTFSASGDKVLVEYIGKDS
jgi:hypothetical protein